ncbi:MAG: MurR/RpiR family transcriptional regulator [Coprobacillus sp.]|nr:MurR/RpiR family transcriptional regulator [Coprobacillus sp.]MCI9094476.1 MurR/RpiR family transcriptional regulator [Coprobacillus sp.]
MINELFLTTKLTPQEQAVASYIQNNPHCILKYNAKELAQKSYVSSPTIIRLVKKLGFKGYLDFQNTYIQEYMMYEDNKFERLNKDSHINDIIQILPKIYKHVFLETQHMIRKESFVRTINYMLQAKQIDFYANDNNFSQIQSACLKLNTLGIRAQAFNTINQGYVDSFQPQDVLSFVVSHSGKNQTMVDVAYYLRKKRVRVIAITGKIDPTLELICNESLYIDSSSHHAPSNIMLYGLSIHYVIDILVTALAIRKVK